MTKIIFLDIDGVLNSQLYYTTGRSDASGVRNDIDPVAIELLNELINKTGAKVVISSSWRVGRTVEELQSILNKEGFTGEVIDKTKDLRDREDGDAILRGNEIFCWIMDNPGIVGQYYSSYKNYVIFDDDTDMLYRQVNNFIRVEKFCGLSPTNVQAAINILNS
jgi:hypothetical protein